MRKILFTIILSLGFIGPVYSENVTMKYGGDWVNTTVIQNDNFMMLQTFESLMLKDMTPLQ